MKITLGQLTDRYDGLSQAMGSFASACGFDERTRELDWVQRANRSLLDALDQGVRRSASSENMVEMARELSGRADDLRVATEEEETARVKNRLGVARSAKSSFPGLLAF